MQKHSLNTRVQVHPATPKQPSTSRPEGTANSCCPFFGHRIAIAPEETQVHASKLEEIRGAFTVHINSPLKHRKLDGRAKAGDASVPVKKEMGKAAFDHDVEQIEQIERLLSSLALDEGESVTSNSVSVSDISEVSGSSNLNGDSFFITSGKESFAVSDPAKQDALDRLRKMIEEDSREILRETCQNTYHNGYVVEPMSREKSDYVKSEGGTLLRPAEWASYYKRPIMELIKRDMEAEEDLNSAVMKYDESVATYLRYEDKLGLDEKVYWLQDMSSQKKSISSIEKAREDLEYQIENLLQSEEFNKAKIDLERLNEEWLPERSNEVSVKANRIVRFTLPDASVNDSQ